MRQKKTVIFESHLTHYKFLKIQSKNLLNSNRDKIIQFLMDTNSLNIFFLNIYFFQSNTFIRLPLIKAHQAMALLAGKNFSTTITIQSNNLHNF